MREFEIFAEESLLLEILSEQKDLKNWNSILANHALINLDMEEEQLDLLKSDPSSSLIGEFMKAHGHKKIIAAKKFFQDFEKDNSIVLDKPFSTYFLEKDDQTVSALSEKFGLIFQNLNVNDEILSGNIYWDLESTETYQKSADIAGWNYLLEDHTKVFNSLIINDPYLFDNPELIKGQYIKTGVLNTVAFLDAILPQKLGVDFHLFLFTGSKNKDMSPAKAESIFNQLTTALATLRPYQILFEFVVCQDTLHRRRAFSNYTIYKTDQGFDIFSDELKYKPKTENDLDVTDIFHSIISMKGKPQAMEIVNRLPLIYKSALDALKDIKDGKAQKGQKCHGFTNSYSIQNRLLKHFP